MDAPHRAVLGMQIGAQRGKILDGTVAQVVGCLPSVQEALTSMPSTAQG